MTVNTVTNEQNVNVIFIVYNPLHVSIIIDYYQVEIHEYT
jgi:hypothetical protein